MALTADASGGRRRTTCTHQQRRRQSCARRQPSVPALHSALCHARSCGRAENRQAGRHSGGGAWSATAPSRTHVAGQTWTTQTPRRCPPHLQQVLHSHLREGHAALVVAQLATAPHLRPGSGVHGAALVGTRGHGRVLAARQQHFLGACGAGSACSVVAALGWGPS